jgi:DNA-binding PadR family transcriptional regulator
VPWSSPTHEDVSFEPGGGDTVSQGFSEFGRFAEPSLYILLALSDGPKHGYAIMTDVEEISGVPLGPGTLYGALARLEQRGLIEALEPEERRRPYRLTGLGATTLRAQLDGLAGFARTGLERLREASR